jgi:hypothetical protein
MGIMMVSVGICAVLGGPGVKEATAMLCPEYYRVRLSAFDEQVFRAFVLPSIPCAEPWRSLTGMASIRF